MGAGGDDQFVFTEFVQPFWKFVEGDVDGRFHMPCLILFLEADVDKLGCTFFEHQRKLNAADLHLGTLFVVKAGKIGFKTAFFISA